MNLRTITPEQKDDLAFLPEEAIAALQAGEEWEYKPDSIEGVDADLYYCDDCSTWHQVWYVYGLRLDADGNLNETLWSVDADGDWQFVDEYSYDQRRDDEQEYRDMRERWRQYAKWVITNRHDPVGEFTRHKMVKRSRTYTAHLVPTVAGVRVGRVRMLKGKYGTLSDFPVEVREFLQADERGFLQEFASLEDARARAMNVKWWGRNNDRITFTIERTVEEADDALTVERAKTFLKEGV